MLACIQGTKKQRTQCHYVFTPLTYQILAGLHMAVLLSCHSCCSSGGICSSKTSKFDPFASPPFRLEIDYEPGEFCGIWSNTTLVCTQLEHPHFKNYLLLDTVQKDSTLETIAVVWSICCWYCHGYSTWTRYSDSNTNNSGNDAICKHVIGPPFCLEFDCEQGDFCIIRYNITRCEQRLSIYLSKTTACWTRLQMILHLRISLLCRVVVVCIVVVVGRGAVATTLMTSIPKVIALAQAKPRTTRRWTESHTQRLKIKNKTTKDSCTIQWNSDPIKYTLYDGCGEFFDVSMTKEGLKGCLTRTITFNTFRCKSSPSKYNWPIDAVGVGNRTHIDLHDAYFLTGSV